MRLLTSNQKYTVDYILEHEHEINANEIPLRFTDYSKEDIQKLLSSLKNTALKERFNKIYNINCVYKRNWRQILRQKDLLTKDDIQELIRVLSKADFREENDFWYSITAEPFYYAKFLTSEQILEHEQDIVWDVVEALDGKVLQDLVNQVQDEEFWYLMVENGKFQYIPTDKYIEQQCVISWLLCLDTIFDNISDDERQTLIDNITIKSFWRALATSPYAYYLTVENVVKNEKAITEWYNVFNLAKFSEEDLQFLTSKLTNEKAQAILASKKDVKNMTADELVKNKKNIDWKGINLEDLKQLSEQEKKALLTTCVDLGVKYAQNVGEDFSALKGLPKNNFYTLNNRSAHDERDGSFIIIKYKDDLDFDVKKGVFHGDMLPRKAKNYPSDVFMQICHVAGSLQAIAEKFDEKHEQSKRSEYDKEDLHCVFGFIHVDENKKNPIAIIDALRIHNFTPQQVANMFKSVKYRGQNIIAVGMSCSVNSESAFMKIASKHKRLIQDYKILYWL